jgi:hypothetical protein
LISVLRVSPLFAQQHNHAATAPHIDGSQHPELIPDLVAYRLYLVTVGELLEATAADKMRQQSHLNRVGLEDDDAAVLLNTANDFKKQYRALIEDYNAHLDPQRIDPVALRAFLLKRDALVISAMNSLSRNLKASAKFDRHIQEEKRHMSTSEVQ